MSPIEKEVEQEDVLGFIREHKKKIILSFIAAAIIVFIVTALAGLDGIISALQKTNYWLLGLSFILEACIITCMDSKMEANTGCNR